MSTNAAAHPRRTPYRNRLRLPAILFIVIVGSLVGLRWMKEVRVHHLQNRLGTELRKLSREIVDLNDHINELKARHERLVRDEKALVEGLEKNKLALEPFDPNTVEELAASPAPVTPVVAQGGQPEAP